MQFEKDGDGPLTGENLSRRYLWQPDAVDQLMADEQVTNAEVPGDVLFALTDHLGTIRDLAVHDSGVTTIANHRVYDSHGNLKSQTNAAVDCLFGFTGRAFDEATGIQDNGERKYDAKVGRFASKDSIGFLGRDANPYRYCGNNSVMYVDPSGLFWGNLLGKVIQKLLPKPGASGTMGDEEIRRYTATFRYVCKVDVYDSSGKWISGSTVPVLGDPNKPNHIADPTKPPEPRRVTIPGRYSPENAEAEAWKAVEGTDLFRNNKTVVNKDFLAEVTLPNGDVIFQKRRLWVQARWEFVDLPN